MRELSHSRDRECSEPCPWLATSALSSARKQQDLATLQAPAGSRQMVAIRKLSSRLSHHGRAWELPDSSLAALPSLIPAR